MQNYLRDQNIPVNEAKSVFRFKTRTALFKENMKSYYKISSCPMCNCNTYPDTQSHSFDCEVTNMNIQIEESFMEIFKKNISQKLSRTLLRTSSGGYIFPTNWIVFHTHFLGMNILPQFRYYHTLEIMMIFRDKKGFWYNKITNQIISLLKGCTNRM